MAPKVKTNDNVRVLATTFDNEDEKDGAGRMYSQKHAHDGNGAYCRGTITRVLKRKVRNSQMYKIKWDDGSTMNCQEEYMEINNEEDDSEVDSDEARDGMHESVRDSGN
jgi:hypothetical protein